MADKVIIYNIGIKFNNKENQNRNIPEEMLTET